MSPIGTILTEIHNPHIGLDDHGNIVLNSSASPNANGPPGIVGPGIASAVTFAAAAGAANICNVTIQVVDSNGTAIAAVLPLTVYLSDAATGIGLTGTTASGGITVGASGTIVGVATTAKALNVVTDATGKFILQITDTAKTHFYVAAVRGTRLSVSAQLTTGNYG